MSRFKTRALVLVAVFVLASNASFAMPHQQKSDPFEVKKPQTIPAAVQFKSFLGKTLTERDQRKMTQNLAEVIVDAAHPTNGGVQVRKCTIHHASAGVYGVNIDLTYFGGFSANSYDATVTLKVTVLQRGLSIDSIDFDDHAPRFKPNLKNVLKVKETINSVIEEG
ncbi:hypothetical protein BH10PLA2_BH10PLA2_23670 [soil metagenome]